MVFFLKSRAKQGCPPSSILFNIMQDVLIHVTKQEKEVRGIQMGKEEIKWSPFADNRIVFVENMENIQKAPRTNK